MERLVCDPTPPTARQEWRHWLYSFKTFITALHQENLNKLGLLTNIVSPRVYESSSECVTYDNVLSISQAQFVKPTSEAFEHHGLVTRRQGSGATWISIFLPLKS